MSYEREYSDGSEQGEHFHARISVGFNGAGAPCPQDLRQRAAELAVIDGLRPEDADARYLDRARRELMGEETRPDDVGELTEGITAWDEVPGSNGHHVPNLAEDDGVSIGEELVHEGIEEAVHEQMFTASQALEHRERGLAANDEP